MKIIHPSQRYHRVLRNLNKTKVPYPLHNLQLVMMQEKYGSSLLIRHVL